MPIILSSRCHFFLFRLEACIMKNWMSMKKCFFFLTLAVDHDETAEIDREMRRRGCAFSSEDSDAECRVTITIPFSARVKQVPQSAWSKKKRLRCKTEKKSKDKKSSKIQPALVLVRMFWGRFRTRSDSIGHARGRFCTRSDSHARSSQIWYKNALSHAQSSQIWYENALKTSSQVLGRVGFSRTFYLLTFFQFCTSVFFFSLIMPIAVLVSSLQKTESL